MKETIVAKFKETYGREPTVVTRAPGRIEFIGNHTDYNGGVVLGASVDRGITVAMAPREDGKRRLASDYSGDSVSIVSVSGGKPQHQAGDASWTNYPLGIVDSFPAFNLTPPNGFDYLAVSDLPVGSGLSSSAAIELASALGFLQITNQSPSREDVVKMARHAENNFVGVPCGILDQGVSGFGKKDHLVFIDCRKLAFRTVPLPADTHFWVFNTHTKHALVDGLYEARHTECMDAASTLGVDLLVDGSIEGLEEAKPKMNEAVYRRAKHIIEEIGRVRDAITALESGNTSKVGKLLTASHRSSQHLFENSTPELDFLVDQLDGIPDVFGARLTGGGFGGAVMAMTNGRFDRDAAELVASAYKQRFQESPDVLHMQTGDGARVL